MFCWFKTAAESIANTKSCMKVYYADETEIFGWYSADLLNPTEEDFK